MVQETAAPTEQSPSLSGEVAQFAPTEVPAEVAAPEVAPAEGEPAETNAEEADASVEEAPEAESVDAILERIKDEEAYKARVERIRRDAERKGMVEGQKREAGRRSQLDTYGAQGVQSLAIIADSLKRAVDEGQITPQAIGAVLQQQAPAILALDSWNHGVASAVHTNGQEYSLGYLVTRIAGHPAVKDADLGQQFADQLHLDFSILDPDARNKALTETVTDLLQAFEERVAEKAKKPAQAQLAKADAAIEKGKLAARANGPDTALKGGGGHKTYTTMTSEERAQLTDAQRDALIAQESR